MRPGSGIPKPGVGGGTLHGAVAGTGGNPVREQIPDCARTDWPGTIAAAANAAPITHLPLCLIFERIFHSSDTDRASAVPVLE